MPNALLCAFGNVNRQHYNYVFFGDLVVPGSAAVAMLMKTQGALTLSAPFLDLHKGHAISDPDYSSGFLGNVTGFHLFSLEFHRCS